MVSKQGRANTQKPKILVQMLGEIIAFFAKAGLDITDYPITFGSWQGSQLLREDLEALLFSQIQVHAKNNHVFGMDSRWGKLPTHKAGVVLSGENGAAIVHTGG